MPSVRAQAAKQKAALAVAVKCRPLAHRDRGRDIIRVHNDKEVLVLDPDLSKDYLDRIQNRTKERKYNFDFAFGPASTNLDVYERSIHSIITGVIQGLNATIFAYGSTGSGKTYTMVGTQDDPGLMVLSLKTVFDLINKDGSCDDFQVTCSYLEVYNEVIFDLLEKSSSHLELREDPGQGITVAGLRRIKVNSADKILELLNLGNTRRKTESTEVNETSSRSHAVLGINVTRKQSKRNQVIRGKLSLVDLAGSERASETNTRDQKLKDGANINRSLLALANCINALGKQQKKGLAYVPYRNSKLTRILKDGLSGNSQTIMIATVSTADGQYHHTINTLKYASRAKEIKTHIQKNIRKIKTQVTDYQRMIDSLQNEVSRLRKELSEKDSQLSAKTSEKTVDNEMSWLNGLSQETSENVQERINLQKALYEIEDINLHNRIELQQLDDAIAKQQDIEKDGAVVQALRVRQQVILDNICDNDELGVHFQKEIEANEKRRCQLKAMIEEAISINGNKTYLHILSQYRLLGMANTELQFEMAMRDQIIHYQREANRNLWNLLLCLGLDEKQILELAVKQGITVEDWTTTHQLGMVNRLPSPDLGCRRYSLSSCSAYNQICRGEPCIIPQHQDLSARSFSTENWQLPRTYCGEEHHSSHYCMSHGNSPATYMRLSSQHWFGEGHIAQCGTSDRSPIDLHNSYTQRNAVTTYSNSGQQEEMWANSMGQQEHTGLHFSAGAGTEEDSQRRMKITPRGATYRFFGNGPSGQMSCYS